MTIDLEKRVIHRFIRNISEYETGGELYSQVIPLDIQAYAIYPNGGNNKLYYVIGDGEHTYTELRSGLGTGTSYREYPVLTKENLETIIGGIEAEEAARKAADIVLQTNIDNEKTRATAAEASLSSNLTTHISNKSNPHEVTKAQIGLGNVDNTSDINKPISTATQEALNAKQNTLVSGTNIKTINNNSLLGSGNIEISEPTKISDLIDDTATNPIDKADTLTDLTATVSELNYVDGVTSPIQTQLDAKQNVLTAGSNVQITGNTISATDTTYTAGTGIDITNGVISNTQTSAEWGNITGTLSAQTDLQNALNAKQASLTAGDNITIDSTTNTISATDTTYTAGTDISITNNAISFTGTIPTVNNNTVTIKQGTVTKGSFTLNQNSDATITLDNTSSGALSDLTDVQISTPTQGQSLTYDTTLNKWKNTSTTATVAWGGITGTLSNQTDLQNALNAKQATMSAGTGIGISNNAISINQVATEGYNINITGTLTTLNGVISGFSSANYATVPVQFSPQNDSWEIVYKFTTASSKPSRYRYIVGSLQGSNSLVIGQYSTGVLTYWLSSQGGTTWDMCADQRGTIVLDDNTTYTVSIAYDGFSAYTMSISTNDGSSWNVDTTLTSANNIYGGTLYLGTPYDQSDDTCWQGSINLNNCRMRIGRQGEIWAGFSTTENIAKATENLYGLVKPDNSTITINNGVISSSSSVEIDNTTITKNASNQLQASSLVNLTATVEELNYVDGVTSNVQTQLDTKANANNVVTLTGTQTIAGTKVFTGNPTIQSAQPTIRLLETDVQKGVTPSQKENSFLGVVYDKNGSSESNKLAEIYTNYGISGAFDLNISCFEPTSGSTSSNSLKLGYDSSKQPYATIITPTEDTTSSNQIDTVGARNTKLATKQDILTAGTNIQINGTTISATDTTYTAGNGLTLTNGQFSANVTNNVTSTSTTNALSANMGKELQDQIDNLKARGRFLSLWNSSTGLAETTPTTLPYDYKTGDYFIIGTTSTTNYKPTGTQYTGTASTTVETESVNTEDVYYFDGTVWHLQINTQKTVTFSQIAGQPTDNTNLATALNAKQDTLTAGDNITITNNVISADYPTYIESTKTLKFGA